jgi:hypothetical protein
MRNPFVCLALLAVSCFCGCEWSPRAQHVLAPKRPTNVTLQQAIERLNEHPVSTKIALTNQAIHWHGRPTSVVGPCLCFDVQGWRVHAHFNAPSEDLAAFAGVDVTVKGVITEINDDLLFVDAYDISNTVFQDK